MRDDLQILLTLFREHIGIVNTLWTIMYAVALGLLGFVYKESWLRRSKLALTILSIGFAALGAGNQTAIIRSQKIIFAVTQELAEPSLLDQTNPSVAAVLRSHEAATPGRIRATHTIFTILVIAALWVPYFVRLEKTDRGDHAANYAPEVS